MSFSRAAALLLAFGLGMLAMLLLVMVHSEHTALVVRLTGKNPGGAAYFITAKNGNARWTEYAGGKLVARGSIVYELKPKNAISQARFVIYRGDSDESKTINRPLPVANNESWAEPVPIDGDIAASAYWTRE